MIIRRSVAIVALSIVLFNFASCSKSQTDTPKIETTSIDIPALQPVLDAQRDAFNEQVPDSLKILFAEIGRQIVDADAVETALKVGDTAPDFILPNAVGEQVQLSALLANGPVILTWYRGGWCPYCNIQLNAYNDVLSEFEKYNGQLVAISPEIPDSSLSTKERDSLAFEVLSDAGNSVAKQFGLVFDIPQLLLDFLVGKLDIAVYNGDNSNTLPLAVTYVIDRDRVIKYAFVQGDYKIRSEPTEIIAELKKLQS